MSDFPELVPLSWENFEETAVLSKLIFPYEEDGPREEMSRCLLGLPFEEENSRDGRLWTISHEGKVVGFTGLYLPIEGLSDFAWLEWYGIAPWVRGHGWGKKLLEATIDIAKKEGFKGMRLYTDTYPNEETAHLVYEKLGFKETGREPTDWGYTMYLELVF